MTILLVTILYYITSRRIETPSCRTYSMINYIYIHFGKQTNMLKYDKKDQYHVIELKNSPTKFIGTIIEDETDRIVISLDDVQKTSPVSNLIYLQKQHIKQIRPAVLERNKVYYLMVDIYARQIKGMEQFIGDTDDISLGKVEFYKVQVDEHLSETEVYAKIQQYLYEYVPYWGGFDIIDEETYYELTQVSEETKLIIRY